MIVLKLLEAQDPLDSVGGLSTGLPQEPEAASGENRSFATKGNIFHLPNHQCSGAFAVTFREIPLGDLAICRIYSGLLVYSLKLILGGCMLKKVG